MRVFACIYCVTLTAVTSASSVLVPLLAIALLASTSPDKCSPNQSHLAAYQLAYQSYFVATRLLANDLRISWYWLLAAFESKELLRFQSSFQPADKKSPEIRGRS